MDYSFIDPGWAVRIHTPIQEITPDDAAKIVELLIKNVVVSWKKQSLTKKEEHDFCEMFGDLHRRFDPKDWDKLDDRMKAVHYRDYPGIWRVTGEPDEKGNPGMFGHDDELAWHNNQPYRSDRKPFVYLYAVKGTKDSVTKWSNHMLAYEDLPQEEKDIYDNLEIQFGDHRTFIDEDSIIRKFRQNFVREELKKNIIHKLVITNPYGRKGISMSPYHAHWISGMTQEQMIKFTDDFLEYIEQPKYVYTHHWDDGDVVIGEQLTSVHKREAFYGMTTRLLHRVAFSPDNFFPEGLQYEGYNASLK